MRSLSTYFAGCTAHSMYVVYVWECLLFAFSRSQWVSFIILLLSYVAHLSLFSLHKAASCRFSSIQIQNELPTYAHANQTKQHLRSENWKCLLLLLLLFLFCGHTFHFGIFRTFNSFLLLNKNQRKMKYFIRMESKRKCMTVRGFRYFLIHRRLKTEKNGLLIRNTNNKLCSVCKHFCVTGSQQRAGHFDCISFGCWFVCGIQQRLYLSVAIFIQKSTF